MPKTAKTEESRINRACEAVLAEEKPNIAKIAREYGVPRMTLSDRVKKDTQARTNRKPVNKALEGYQEEALIRWIVRMRDWNMPVTPRLLQEWANRALARAGKLERQVSEMWAYRFEKRLPGHLKLGSVKQKTKESKRIQAEDAGFLQHWYDLLSQRRVGKGGILSTKDSNRRIAVRREDEAKANVRKAKRSTTMGASNSTTKAPMGYSLVETLSREPRNYVEDLYCIDSSGIGM